MAREAVGVKRYVVRLSGEERAHLEAMLRKGKHGAKTLIKAHILLKADVSEAGEGLKPTARSSNNWRRARRWSIGCASSS